MLIAQVLRGPRSVKSRRPVRHTRRWHESSPGRFGLDFDDCGYFDIDGVLGPGYGLTRGSFSFRVSDHYPMWARFV